jgi:hypothetical protein
MRRATTCSPGKESSVAQGAGAGLGSAAKATVAAIKKIPMQSSRAAEGLIEHPWIKF